MSFRDFCDATEAALTVTAAAGNDVTTKEDSGPLAVEAPGADGYTSASAEKFQKRDSTRPETAGPEPCTESVIVGSKSADSTVATETFSAAEPAIGLFTESETAPPLTPGESPTVVELRLAAAAPGTAKPRGAPEIFNLEVKADVCGAASVLWNRLDVVTVREGGPPGGGGVTVRLRVLPPAPGEDGGRSSAEIARDLQAQATEPGSILRQGMHTSRLVGLAIVGAGSHDLGAQAAGEQSGEAKPVQAGLPEGPDSQRAGPVALDESPAPCSSLESASPQAPSECVECPSGKAAAAAAALSDPESMRESMSSPPTPESMSSPPTAMPGAEPSTAGEGLAARLESALRAGDWAEAARLSALLQEAAVTASPRGDLRHVDGAADTTAQQGQHGAELLAAELVGDCRGGTAALRTSLLGAVTSNDATDGLVRIARRNGIATANVDPGELSCLEP
jgi:hypothetical protein